MSRYRVLIYSLSSHPDSLRYRQFLCSDPQATEWQLVAQERGAGSSKSRLRRKCCISTHRPLQINPRNKNLLAADNWLCLLRAMNSQVSDRSSCPLTLTHSYPYPTPGCPAAKPGPVVLTVSDENVRQMPPKPFRDSARNINGDRTGKG